MLPFFDKLEKRVGAIRSKSGVRTQPRPIFFTGLAMFILAFLIMPRVVMTAVSITFFFAPLWLPVLVLWSAWGMWVILKRSEFIVAQKVVLLEIKPPRNVVKTPLAMEAVLAGLHFGPGEATWYKKYFLGSVRPWWSLEIASIEGQVHFFIWTRSSFRRAVETQLYAQYPGIQVVEAVDYTRLITAKPEEWTIWGCDFVKGKQDPLPIKTYVEYGLDKVQKEPEQVDPLANLIEFMGSMGKGEQMWVQLAIRVHKGEKYDKEYVDATGKSEVFTWKHEGREMVKKLREATRDKYVDQATGKETLGFPNPTKGQIEEIAAIERNIGKLAFDVGARAIYLAKPESFDSGIISGLTSVFKQFSSEGWNSINPSSWMTVFNDYPWEIGTNKLKDNFRRWMVEAYRRRQFFHVPFESGTMVMSIEELATLYHIPSQAVETPSLRRIQSATGSAPVNLPT